MDHIVLHEEGAIPQRSSICWDIKGDRSFKLTQTCANL